jgi:NAD(P)H-flavin reductase
MAAAAAELPTPFRVVKRTRETHDTWTLVLEPESGEPILAQPGQFTMLYAFGAGEVPISVSGVGGEQLVHTVRAVGDVSRAICDSRPGAVLGVRGPFGNAWPLAEAVGDDVVVIAGGIGLAPLRAAFLHLLEHRADYGEVALLYGARTPADLLYTKELERWRRHEGVQVDITVDTAEGGWRGKVGVVPKLIAGASFDRADVQALIVGPEIMMRFSAQALLARGVAPERIHLSMERDMKCGLGHCGHCQLGPTLICRDGPVYSYDRLAALMAVREL